MKAFHNNASSFIISVCDKILSFLLFVLVVQNVAAAGAIRSLDFPGNETDRSALLAIKSQLNTPDGALSSWNHSVHHCHWEGVACGHKHNRVTRLDLNFRGLSGTISSFIGNLTFQNTIYLYNNSLYGNIPNSLGNLFRLKYLGLSDNTLIGEIPVNLSSCINLVFLNMDDNKLEGKLPTELRALTKLEKLQVYANNLIGPLFNTIQNLTSLKLISVTYNTFTGTIPSNIDRLQNLKFLDAGSNKLSGTLPSSIFNISSLETLSVAHNQFNGEITTNMAFNVPRLTWLSLSSNNFSGSIIPLITNFTTLEAIEFEHNSFTGRIAINFGQFYNLQYLDLSWNNLKGDISFINTLTNCSKLYKLAIGANQLSGGLPKSVANLSTSLTIFLTGDNSIRTGEFPIGITNLINLQALSMSNNELTSFIPRDIGKLQKLEYLILDFNTLTGKIPDSLSNLSRLSRLYLFNNKLEGSIPQSIGNCRSLSYLDLSNNDLNGTLENNLFTGFATFIRLDLSNNSLEGPLPLEISTQISLVELKLSNNKLGGVLPDGLRECTGLQSLRMAGNSFYGDIPSSYASLTGLQEIDFSQNNLSGPIPAFFSKFSMLYYLNLSHNDFQGSVPTDSVFANKSAIFLVGNNRLCGGIPALHLPKCIEKSMSNGSKIIIITVVTAVVGTIAILIGIYMACVRKKKAPLSSDSVMGESFMKVSYNMLLKATDGFSSDTLLGSGSFGSVFKGILDGKAVAVKVVNLQHHDASKSFMAECKALKNLRHRNLVGIITACLSTDFQRNDFRALVYEFMPNGSLDKWLNGIFGNLSLRQRLDIVIDVAHALNYLHHECETPIVHCDLKPSNILLDQDIVAHVGDFGLTRFLTQPRHPNQSSTLGVMGTIGYAAPEYGLGSGASTAGDVYSYGILLLELITGKGPTDSMFKEDYNLHTYAEAALPDQVLQIVDPTLEEDNITAEADNTRAIQDALQRKQECLVSVISVGVLCSKHFPQDRLKIPEAISKLESARKNLLNTRNRRNLSARGGCG